MDAPNGGNGSGSQVPIDPITLGQIKAAMANSMKPKQSWYDYKYDDEDTVMAEIEEFYSYIEMPQAVENLRAWEDSYMPEWMKASSTDRRTHVQLLLESLEHKDGEIRFTNARRLLYVLQGTFAETGSPEDQLHWIFENAKIVREADGVSCIVEAIKIATKKHDFLCGLSDQDATRFNISLGEKADLMEEILTELSVYFGMLYHLIEVFKGHEDFAEELMSLDPPLPVYLFSIISNLRDKSAKGYPIKKLLLLMWKTLLACWGGMRDYARVKKLARELAGLPPITDDNQKIKTTAIDIEQYRCETSVKYPSFTPPASPPQTLAEYPIARSNSSKLTHRLSQAYIPIPLRHHYHHEELEPAHTGMIPGTQSGFQQQQMGPNGPFRQNPQPPTPAPSPPPSPKPKKQQYQTDQGRPFLLPFTGKKGKNATLVPFAIDEAERLFNRHMYVSLTLTQIWRTREDCMTSESGLDKMPGMDETYRSSTFLSNELENEPLPDVDQLNREIEAMIKAEKEAATGTEKRKWRERKEDLMRLKRVEQVYGAVLPHLSGWVLVLLKLLLATVSASTNGLQNPQQSGSSVFPPGVSSPINSAPDQPPPQTPSLDEIDVTRHREITSKAVSAILFIVLKWFKVSHAMKFHHLGHHLLDTNCLLLILKMFGLQEISHLVVSKADSPENNFFQFCLNYSKNPQPNRPEDNSQRTTRQSLTRTVILPNGEKHEEEIEHIHEYSWRNFFATINYARIMQKLSKGRPHRIWMLVHYKSSAVLKRVLRVMHPMLQLNILKLIKSQVPYCGRRWRQSNMKVITAIYLNCRPDLRDEWLTGNEMEEGQGAQAQEQALRHLVKFYNTKRYGSAAPGNQNNSPKHRRSGSISQQMDGLHPPELVGMIRPLGTPNTVDADVFPPPRSQAPDPNIFLPYITEDIAFEEEYEEYLKDLGYSDEQTGDMPLFGGASAWSRLPFETDIADGISDSESVVSIGELGDDTRLDHNRDDKDIIDENRNNWEQLSPKTMAALPKSPAGNRRSSSGSGLRPVVPFLGLDDGSAVDLDDIEEPELGPAPREQSSPFAEGAGVDEVEYAYGV
ncbi:N1221-domain-containing protein [Macrolepiota fuliginosa MF-IS2]|uniref:N1221-domain-containing protein n=1 Tax=Macrolepiota fuliginosa MF-IS2 TaxID=1400762 RepID=A0A9P5XJR6_9AGAR|nr:N1221-domain-containing protein [Macrolepiota fuliginosa MF-IS2]